MTESRSLSEVNETVEIPQKQGMFRRLFAFAGPAHLVSVGYMDPGNWATDIAAGSRYGYSLLRVLIARPDLPGMAKGLIPGLPDADALYFAVGILGATVMPHNLYLHSALVQSRKVVKTARGLRQALKFNMIDSVVALNGKLLLDALSGWLAGGGAGGAAARYVAVLVVGPSG